LKFGIPFVPVICQNTKLKEIMPDVKSAESYAEKYFWKPDSILYMPSKQEKSLKSIFDVAYKLSLKTGA